ncbi:MAG: hypothetical protein U0R51_09335 [Solirubrobacterales bacterium]
MVDRRNPAEKALDQRFTLRMAIATGVVVAVIFSLLTNVSAGAFVLLVLAGAIFGAAWWRLARFMIDGGRR